MIQKVIFISLSLDYHKSWGGSEELWFEAAQQFHTSGYEVAVSFNKTKSISPKLEHLQTKGVQIYWRSPIHKYTNWIIQFFFSTLTKRILQYKKLVRISNPYKKLIGQKSLWVINAAYAFTLTRKVHLLSFLLNSKQPYCLIFQWQPDFYWSGQIDRILMQSILRNALHSFFVSERQRNLIERQIAFRLKNASVAYNPIDLEKLHYTPFPQKKVAQFAVVARLETKDKGQDLLFEVLGSHKWRDRKWELNLYGEGVDKAYLKELSQFYKIESKVFFHGYTDVSEVWKDNHLCIMPSYVEGTPLALLEALYCGRVAVVTDIGGNAEWVEEGRNGFVAEAPLSKYLNCALERAWDNRKRWKKMGETAHQMISEKHKHQPKLFEQLIKLMNSIEVEGDG